MTGVTHTETNRNTFGGIIDTDDFSTASPNKKRIHNQVQAEMLPETLKQKLKNKRQEEKFKSMTLEELREMKLVSNTNGRPLPSLTDEKWQKEFNIRKMFITPYPKNYKKLGGRYSREFGTWNTETQGTYYGSTNWQEICAHINDILRNIRSGQVDYCYYIYNIMELAKFHYHNLRTKYCDGYWEVWLER